MLTDFKVLIMMEASSSLESLLSAYEWVTDDSVYDRTNGVGGIERSQFILDVLKGYLIVSDWSHVPRTEVVYAVGEALSAALYSELIHNKALPSVTKMRDEVLDVAFKRLVEEAAR